MYFTQEDYKKIENWLHRNSVKDTEFQEALPFTGKEIVTVVQDGHNRKVNIQEFINQLYKHGVEDFLNVTNTYRANNITLKEAIRLIPAEARKEGQVITFLNTEGNWEIYQFTGKLNQWNNTTLWNNPFDWEKLIVDSILPDEEDLTKSEPDAKGNSYLSLKNRKYEPDKYSGLGRKILRRRVVEIEDPIYGTQEKNLLLQADFAEDNTVYVVRYDFTLNGQDITLPDNSYIEYEGGSISDGNIIDRAGGFNRVILKKNIVNGKSILTQEMVSKSNTIYEIRYDFDLNSEEITIPENCVLDFQGGSFNNGTIIGNNTEIIANKVNIFKLISIQGSWKVDTIYSNWFDFKLIKEYDNSNNFNNLSKLLSDDIHNTLYISEGIYFTQPDYGTPVEYHGSITPYVIKLCSNTTVYNNATIKLLKSSIKYDDYVIIGATSEEGRKCSNIEIIGGNLIGNLQYFTAQELYEGETTREWGFGIYMRGVDNVLIRDVKISYCIGDGLAFSWYYYGSYSDTEMVNGYHTSMVTVQNCISSYNRRQGMSIIDGCHNFQITNCTFEKTGKYLYTSPGAGIDIEPNFNSAVSDSITIRDCNFIDNYRGIELYRGAKLITVDNCNMWHTSDYVSKDNPLPNDDYGKAPQDLLIYTSTFDEDTNIIVSNCNMDSRIVIYNGNLKMYDSKFKSILFMDASHDSHIFNRGISCEFNKCFVGYKNTSNILITKENNKSLSYFKDCVFNDCFINIIDYGYITTNNYDIEWPIDFEFYNCKFEGKGAMINIAASSKYTNCVFNNIESVKVDLHNINKKCTIYNSIMYLNSINREVSVDGVPRFTIGSPDMNTDNELLFVSGLQFYTQDSVNKKVFINCSANTNGKYILHGINIVGIKSDETANMLNYIAKNFPTINLSLSNQSKFGIINVSYDYLNIIGTSLGSEDFGEIVLTYPDKSIATHIGNYWTNAKGIRLDNVKAVFGNVDKRNEMTKLSSVNRGLEFFDTTYNKTVIWDGSKWIEYDGASAGVSRYGITSNRPGSDKLYRGFQFYDTSIEKPIWWNGTKWVDATGADV